MLAPQGLKIISLTSEFARNMGFGLLLFFSFLLTYSSAAGDAVMVWVDPQHGDDNNCLSALDLLLYSGSRKGAQQSYPKLPCATMDAALYGNRTFDEKLLKNCSAFPHHLANIHIILAEGVHRLRERLPLIKATNLTIAAKNSGKALIECTTFPNTIPGNYDNVFACQSHWLRFEGVVFERCGPVPSNVFVYNSSYVTFEKCTFR